MSMSRPNSQGGGRTTAMLPGLRSDLLARPSASSSDAVRPSKFPLASFRHLPLRLSCPQAPRQSAFLPSPISSFRPSSPHPVPSHIAIAARVVPSCPIPLGPAPSVATVCDKRDSKSEKKKKESRKKNNNRRRRTCRACLSPRVPSDVAIAAHVGLARPGRLLLYSTEKEVIGKEEE